MGKVTRLLIYKVTNKLNGKVYIGQTTETLAKRKSRHYQSCKKGDSTHFYNALRKYGKDAFTWEAVDLASSLIELNEKEDYWVNYYDSMNKGYNMIRGGKSNPMHHPEVKAKHLEKVQSEEFRANTSKIQIELHAKYELSAESRKRISDKLKGNRNFAGHKLTEDHKRKLFEARDKSLAGYNHSDEVKEVIRQHSIRNSEKLCMPIDQYTLDDKFIQTHRSLAVAAIYIHGTHVTLKKYALSGKPVYGYIWKLAK